MHVSPDGQTKSGPTSPTKVTPGGVEACAMGAPAPRTRLPAPRMVAARTDSLRGSFNTAPFSDGSYGFTLCPGCHIAVTCASRGPALAHPIGRCDRELASSWDDGLRLARVAHHLARVAHHLARVASHIAR